MFAESDVVTVAPIEHIRSHPEMYFPEGRIGGGYLAGRLVGDVVTGVIGETFAVRTGDWWIVASETDWMSDSHGRSVQSFFECVVPFPEGGQNAMRSEALISARARDVVTSDGTNECIIKGRGDSFLTQLIRRHPQWRRCVAFRLVNI